MKNSGTTRTSKRTSAVDGPGMKPQSINSAKNSAEKPAGSPSSFAAAFRGRSLWICLGIVLLIFAVYAPVWNFDFVDTDDPAYLYENPQVSAGLKWKGVVWSFTTLHEANWHPVTWLSHMLDVQLFGMSPGPHHIISVVLHVANTLLLFGVLYWMTGLRLRSATVAALFALHPLHVESVAWLAERKDVLSTLFMLLAIFAYANYVRRPGLLRYLLVLLLFGLGLMSKPMLVTLPFILLLLDIWPLKRVHLKHLGMTGSNSQSGCALQQVPRASAIWVICEKIPLLLLSIASSIVTYVAQQRGGALHQFNQIPLGIRLENAFVSYVVYLGKTFCPTRLAVNYPFPRSVPLGEVLAAVALLIVVSGFALRQFNTRPYLLIGWLWFIGTLVPVIGIIQVGGQARADRYTYIPLIGIFTVLAWGIADLLAESPHRMIILPTVVGASLFLCAALSSVQLEQWRNPLALWSHAVRVAPENHVAHLNLGAVLLKGGRVAEALQQDYQAVQIRPDLEITHNNLAAVLMAAGQTNEARAHYELALQIKPDYPDARNSLGRILANNGQLDEAIQQFVECLKYRPENAEAHANLGFVLAKLNRLSEAEHEFKEALRDDPGNQIAQQGLEFVKSQSTAVEVGSRR